MAWTEDGKREVVAIAKEIRLGGHFVHPDFVHPDFVHTNFAGADLSDIDMTANHKYCTFYDNGEFNVNFPPDKMTPGPNNAARRNCLFSCELCGMSEFKSAVNEALDGKASLSPRDWLCEIPESSDPSFGVDPIVDVLICQNTHCGQYHTLHYKFLEGGVLIFASKANFTSKDMTDRQNLILSSIGEQGIFPVLACYISDFLVPSCRGTGFVRPRDASVSAKNDQHQDLEINSCTCFHSDLWTRTDSRPMEQDKMVISPSGARVLDVLVHGCRNLEGREAKILYRYNHTTPVRYGRGPFVCNLILGRTN